MEVYILDDLLRRATVIDRFESLIWTERHAAFGDFQLVIHSTMQSRSQLVEGKMLGITASKRVMVIENVENKDDAEGRLLLTVSGRSLEYILEERTLRKDMGGSAVEVPDYVSPELPPAQILKDLFIFVCVTGALSPLDKIPMYASSSLYPPNTIVAPAEPVSLTFEPQSVYEALKTVCDIYGMGFRLYKGVDTSTVHFDIYTGDDRTSGQTTLPAVIFSPDLENLTNTSEFRSIERYKNAALVTAANGSRWVYPDEDSALLSGFDRRVLYVTADDIELPAGPDLDIALDFIGKQELTKHKPLKALDGELPANSKYRYGVDYELGDLVEMRNEDGLTNRMRVTEQIFVDDSEGERSYPTLALDEFITPGTWAAWDSNGVWADAPGVWAFAGGSTTDENVLLNGGLERGDYYEWGGYLASNLNVTTVPAEVHSGTYALKVVTTGSNGGVANTTAAMGPTPMGVYSAGVWVKCVSGQTLRFSIQERSVSDALVAESPVVTITSNGGWQLISDTTSKTQAETLLRISVQKVTAGTFFVDDAYINYI